MRRSLFLAVALALWPAASVLAGEVIAHPGLVLGRDEIRDVYLGEKQLAGNLRIVPVDNPVAQEAFLAALMQTTLRNYEARWVRKNFREGLRAPAPKGGDAEVIAFVRATPGAIGYIAGRTGPKDGVSVLHEF